jgi:hypothetical protein
MAEPSGRLTYEPEPSAPYFGCSAALAFAAAVTGERDLHGKKVCNGTLTLRQAQKQELAFKHGYG